jgi:hypothetical protein
VPLGDLLRKQAANDDPDGDVAVGYRLAATAESLCGTNAWKSIAGCRAHHEVPANQVDAPKAGTSPLRALASQSEEVSAFKPSKTRR